MRYCDEPHLSMERFFQIPGGPLPSTIRIALATTIPIALATTTIRIALATTKKKIEAISEMTKAHHMARHTIARSLA